MRQWMSWRECSRSRRLLKFRLEGGLCCSFLMNCGACPCGVRPPPRPCSRTLPLKIPALSTPAFPLIDRSPATQAYTHPRCPERSKKLKRRAMTRDGSEGGRSLGVCATIPPCLWHLLTHAAASARGIAALRQQWTHLDETERALRQEMWELKLALNSKGFEDADIERQLIGLGAGPAPAVTMELPTRSHKVEDGAPARKQLCCREMLSTATTSPAKIRTAGTLTSSPTICSAGDRSRRRSKKARCRRNCRHLSTRRRRKRGRRWRLNPTRAANSRLQPPPKQWTHHNRDVFPSLTTGQLGGLVG